MAFTVKDVISRATTILQDGAATRWTPPELLMWTNDAVREISVYKPSATSQTVELPLVAGTKQTLPAEYHTLVKVTRNIGAAGKGRAITPILRETLDMQIPGWHDTSVLAFSEAAIHILDDATDPAVFYVVPGNTGTGKIEAVVSGVPEQLAVPANLLDQDAYKNLTVPIADIYLNAVVDYVLYRSFSKDMAVAGAAQRASALYQQFANAIGLKMQAETANNVNESARSRYSA